MICEVCGAPRAWRCLRRLTCERVALCLRCLAAERAEFRRRIDAWIVGEIRSRQGRRDGQERARAARASA